MTELEKMQRANMYISKLANGIDPISDAELPNDSILNNVRLSRCFFYVSEILRQVIENGGTDKKGRKDSRIAFALTAESRDAFEYSKEPISISDFVSKLNDLIDATTMRTIASVTITNWLVEKGFLLTVEMPNGKKSRHPTKQGEDIGLSWQLRQGREGDYHMVFYNEYAQRFIIDHLEDIVQEHRKKI